MPSIANMFETATRVIGSLMDDEKTPLHVGEAMSCWMYLAFVEDIIVYDEVALNTTTDQELRDIIEEGLKIVKSHQKQLENFLRLEGVPLPDASEEKPKSEVNVIPLGTKFTDKELSNALGINFQTATVSCAQAASQSIRNDVGLMFLKFQLDKMTLGTKLKMLRKKRGWLKTPPFFYPPGGPN